MKNTNNIKNEILRIKNVINISEDVEMPIIIGDDTIPQRLISFNEVLTSKDFEASVHFFIDDYQLEKIWDNPLKYFDKLKKFKSVLSPNFSTFSNSSKSALQWNTYRNRLIGSLMQKYGIKVIPTISWSKEMHDFYFEGISNSPIVAISTNALFQDEKKEVYLKGIQKIIEKINPKNILIYGYEIPFDSLGANIIYYNNKFVERLRKNNITKQELQKKQEFFFKYATMYDDYSYTTYLYRDDNVFIYRQNGEYIIELKDENIIDLKNKSGNIYSVDNFDYLLEQKIGDKTIYQIFKENNFDIPILNQELLAVNPTMTKDFDEFLISFNIANAK